MSTPYETFPCAADLHDTLLPPLVFFLIALFIGYFFLCSHNVVHRLPGYFSTLFQLRIPRNFLLGLGSKLVRRRYSQKDLGGQH